jgi:hypothetical protein
MSMEQLWNDDLEGKPGRNLGEKIELKIHKTEEHGSIILKKVNKNKKFLFLISVFILNISTHDR